MSCFGGAEIFQIFLKISVPPKHNILSYKTGVFDDFFSNPRVPPEIVNFIRDTNTNMLLLFPATPPHSYVFCVMTEQANQMQKSGGVNKWCKNITLLPPPPITTPQGGRGHLPPPPPHHRGGRGYPRPHPPPPHHRGGAGASPPHTPHQHTTGGGPMQS